MSNRNNDSTHGLNEPHFGGESTAIPGDDDAAGQEGGQPQEPTINSINSTSKKGNKALRAFFVLVVCALVIGLGVFFGIKWLTQMKEVVRESSMHRKGAPSADSPNSLNPESTARTGSNNKPRALGADGVAPAPMGSAAAGSAAGGGADEVRPIRGSDGQIVVNAGGKALGVDGNGHVVEVPAIGTVDGTEQRTKRPLPGQSNVAGVQQGAAGGGQPEKKPPSRYGGALLADGLTSSAIAQANAASDSAASRSSTAEQRTFDLVRSLLPHGQDATSAASTVAAAAGQDGASKQNSGPVASQLSSSHTAVAVAARMPDQTLLLPKNRQGDCILTTRIVNELPGLTSCTLTQNLYGADGKVILLERGSEISGEYGVSNQTGQRRLFIVWTRVRTPEGVEVDIQSPAADPLGTSGVPGYLEQRWVERIGAALLVSVMKDTLALALERAAPTTTSSSVVVQPGQNTVQTGQDLAEQVLKQTINTRPTLYINEGTRVSVFVARDLDFSPVYRLKTVSAQTNTPSKVN